MRHFIVVIAYAILAGCKTNNASNPLFIITQHNKFGFIDSTGKIIINPIFISASDFSEGLASARISGLYGYIDKKGNFAIKPQFEYATPFSEGLAVVYKDGKPFVINAKGEEAFNCNFSEIQSFESGRAIVKTASGKFGVINKEGKLFIDTVFSKLYPFINGFSTVIGLNDEYYANKYKGPQKKLEHGVIDSLGNFVIPYGRYEFIKDLDDGYFEANFDAEPWDSIEGYTSGTTIIDTKGKIVVSKQSREKADINGNLHCGLIKVYVRDSIATSGRDRQGYINAKGEIAINDPSFISVEDFSDNRAFVECASFKHCIINTKGGKISDKIFDGSFGNHFKNGLAFVQVGEKWGLIDTNANYIFKPQFDGIKGNKLIDNYFFYSKRNPDGKNSYYELIGIANKDGHIITEPTMQSIDENGYKHGLLACFIDNKLTYINKQGKTVWQDTASTTYELDYDIDFMKRGYFKAYSLPSTTRSNGEFVSRNIPEKIIEKKNFQQNTLSVSVDVTHKDSSSSNPNFLNVYIINNTKDKVNFNAQDSRLYMKVQALNPHGEWKDIEYLPSSWCGNSYHIITLEPQYYWSFHTPKYTGDFHTKLRIELKCVNPNDKSDISIKKELTIYSNEYECSINLAQFWRKKEYYPAGIMDPYLE